jgi:hypothetical protein
MNGPLRALQQHNGDFDRCLGTSLPVALAINDTSFFSAIVRACHTKKGDASGPRKWNTFTRIIVSKFPCG